MKTHNFKDIIKEFNAVNNYKFVFHKDITAVTIFFNKVTNKSTLRIAPIEYVIRKESGTTVINTTLEKVIEDKKFIRYGASYLPTGMVVDYIYNWEKNKDIEVVMWDAKKIKYAYLHTNYSRDCGSLASSCMRSKDMQKSLNFYERCGCKIVVIVTPKNKIIARALFWPEVYFTKEGKSAQYLDRVYYSTSSSAQLAVYRKLVEKIDCHSYDFGMLKSANKSNMYVKNIDMEGIYHCPYTDTFRKLYYKDGIVGTSTKGCYGTEHIGLTHTADRGYFRQLDPHAVQEVLTSAWISKKDAVFVKQYKGYVLKDNLAIIDDVYYSSHDTKKVLKTKMDGWILVKNRVEEVLSLDNIDKTKAIKIKRYSNKYVHTKNIITINDKQFHKADENIIRYKDKKWYDASQCLINRKSNEQGEKVKQTLIPKKFGVICYSLSEDTNGNLVWKEVYKDEKECDIKGSIPAVVKLTTGEWIVNDTKSRNHVKRYNKRFYIKKDWKPIDKNQMLLPFKDCG